MNVTLTRKARSLLLFLAAAGYVAWLSDLGARSEAAGYESPYPSVGATPNFQRDRSIAGEISRDPFAGAPHHAVVSDEAIGTPSRETPRAPGAQPSRIFDVPDIAEGDEPSEPLTLVARATIVGTTPIAYVEHGAIMEVVRVGDTLGQERVTRIDLRGLTFADGTRLDLPNFDPTPLPAPATMSVERRLDDIRRLLVTRAAAPKGVSPPENHVEPQATPALAYPTPAPLATVDMRGLPAGTNPTPDPDGPTPFPEPYPYAPAR